LKTRARANGNGAGRIFNRGGCYSKIAPRHQDASESPGRCQGLLVQPDHRALSAMTSIRSATVN